MSTIRIGAALFLVLGFVQAYDPGKAYDGYTTISYSLGEGSNTVLINNDGDLINRWNLSDCGEATSFGYLQRNGDLVYPCDKSGQGGPNGGGTIHRYDWNNNLLWEYTLRSDNISQHHDIHQLENGNVLLIAHEKKTAEEYVAKGGDPNNIKESFGWFPLVVEVKPDYESGIGGEIVWEWHMWDHFVQDVNPAVDTFGVVADHPQRVDMNCRSINRGGDYLHQNAIHHNEVLDQIIVSSRVLGELYIIDHTTTSAEAATEQGGRYGGGGGLMYRWGDPQNWRMGPWEDKILFGQHSVNWIEKSLTNLILFNNGANVGNKGPTFPGYSTALEFVLPLLPNGTYYREEGKPYGPIAPK